ncbi:MAG: SCO7613 C-terminal domain-containing membrane protein [Blastococcus sp.]
MPSERGGPWALACPVCGRPVDAPPAVPCPQCGLPAAGQAALVMARIGTTLTELARDRDALLATLRASAPYASAPYASAGVGPHPMPAPPPMPPPPLPPAPAPPAGGTTRRLRRRLSPQQVLLGLGALLVVAAAIAFVAVAWTRFGVAFQAGVMLVITAATCGVSAWSARRRLRATEEALAAAGAALMVVDLGGARALGLLSFEDVSLRLYAASSCAIVLALTLVLGRLTRTTATWPLAALLAGQPLPLLLLPPDDLSGPAGVGAVLALAAVDLLVVARLRHGLRPVAVVLAGLAGTSGVVGGLLTAGTTDPSESWLATGLLLLAGAGAVAATGDHGPALLRRFPVAVAAVAAAVSGLALTGSLGTTGDPGPIVATAAGLFLLTAAVLLVEHRRTTAVLVAGGGVLALVGARQLGADHRLDALALLVLAATAPAVLAAVRLPALRSAATAAALFAPAAAILLGRGSDRLATTVAGLLLALLAAAAFGVATARTGHPEEWVAAAGGALAGLAAGANTWETGAWGQVGLQLAIAGAAAGGYALVASRRWVGVLAVADLVIAAWIAIGGAGVDTPEAYTLPAAAGLVIVALPQLRSGARSWAAEGAALAVALVPSAFVVVASPTALRLVLVVAAAAAVTVLGTLTHRQAPFVLGATVLAAVVIGRLAPYAPLLPRWLTLGAAGLVLLLLGATYERRRQQAREAVAWIGQMH